MTRTARCQNCKMQKSQYRRGANQSDQVQHRTKATKFGEHLTADHAITGNGAAGRHGERVALIIQDEATGWPKAYPSLSKDSDSVVSGFQDFCLALSVSVFTLAGPKNSSQHSKGFKSPMIRAPRTDHKVTGWQNNQCVVSRRGPVACLPSPALILAGGQTR